MGKKIVQHGGFKREGEDMRVSVEIKTQQPGGGESGVIERTYECGGVLRKRCSPIKKIGSLRSAFDGANPEQ